MANTKYTSRDFYNDVIEGRITDTVINYAKSAIKKMDEKNNARKGSLTESQKANAQTKDSILAAIQAEPNKRFTAKVIADMFDMSSTQRATALLMQMVKDELVKVEDFTPSGKKKDMVKGYFVEG